MVSEVSGVLFDCKERVEKETFLYLKVKKHKDKGKKETIMEWLLDWTNRRQCRVNRNRYLIQFIIRFEFDSYDKKHALVDFVAENDGGGLKVSMVVRS